MFLFGIEPICSPAQSWWFEFAKSLALIIGPILGAAIGALVVFVTGKNANSTAVRKMNQERESLRVQITFQMKGMLAQLAGKVIADLAISETPSDEETKKFRESRMLLLAFMAINELQSTELNKLLNIPPERKLLDIETWKNSFVIGLATMMKQ